MSDPVHSPAQNRLLAVLPPIERVYPALELVHMVRAHARLQASRTLVLKSAVVGSVAHIGGRDITLRT